MIQVLLVDDEKPFREFLTKKLTKEGYQVTPFGTGKEALQAFGENEYDVALLDISLPDISGIDLLKKIQSSGSDTECIMLTGYGSIESAIESMKMGAYDYLEKPAKITEIKLILQKAYEKCRMNREIHNIKEERKRSNKMYKMVGQSSTMKKLRILMEKVAKTTSSVLIEGGSGTGKELVAREIHCLSPQNDAPFISIDCGALPEHLLENELFGHAKGAYTGADSKQTGLIELANNGTLFMDEVGELALNMQKKFLRFLETGEFRRLGDSKLRHVKVRIIAATNRNLKKAISEGFFREDLYYRLDVFKIQVPSLMERKEDIPLLVQHFLKIHSSAHGRTISIQKEVSKAFLDYHWPGNIRELKNVIERAVILATDNLITLEDIPPLYEEEKEVFSPQEVKKIQEEYGNFKSLEDLEKEHIFRALEMAKANKTQAAKALGISLRSLYRKLDKYGLS